MPNKLPEFLDNHKISIICEGNEEYEYLNRLKNLKSPAKPVNSPLIKKFTGVENYKGRADQIKEVMEHITVDNYANMCQRVSQLKTIDSVTGSSNFGKFIKLFESDDSGWIEKINIELEK